MIERTQRPGERLIPALSGPALNSPPLNRPALSDLAKAHRARTRAVRLLSVPSRHPYVDAVRPATTSLVEPDRVLNWEPDPVFTPGYVAARAGQIDIVHLHFSFDHLDRPAARAWLAELDAAVLTLTRGAAAEIAERFGVRATVVPHPSLVDPTRTAAVVTEPGLAALHLKSLRRNLVDPLALVAAAADGAQRAGGRLRVDLHPEVVEDPRLSGLGSLAAERGVELVVHPRFDDIEIERYVRRAHVTVLPYRWGTHSGWLELARDLGTRVVAPDVGYYPDQWSEVVSYRNNEVHGLAAESLAAAVATALATPAPGPAERSSRLAETTATRRTHARTYRHVRR